MSGYVGGGEVGHERDPIYSVDIQPGRHKIRRLFQEELTSLSGYVGRRGGEGDGMRETQSTVLTYSQGDTRLEDWFQEELTSLSGYVGGGEGRGGGMRETQSTVLTYSQGDTRLEDWFQEG